MQNLSINRRVRLQPIQVILLVAALLRIPYLFTGSYAHDELSALYRIQVPCFTDLFSSRGLVDAHPPLVQVFLYAWTGVFGDAEWVVKLPFLLCGMGAIYVTWRLGQRFYSPQAALATAALMAVAQLYVFHSLMARPYAPGLLFTLLATEKWLQCFAAGENTRKNMTLYILYTWLGFFTHHFCTLHMLLMITAGIFLLRKNQWKQYVRIHLVLLLLSLPVLYIMLFQLRFKGIGSWLNPPDPDFIWQFFRYLFHYQPLYLWLMLAGAMGAALVYFRGKKEKTRPYIPVLMLLFVMVYAAGHAYSVYRAPLLQFSLLQFSLPFFLLGIFQVLAAARQQYWSWIITVFVLGMGCFSLLFNRAHHDLMNDFPYRALAGFSRPYQHGSTLIITSDRPAFLKRYMPLDNVVSTYADSNAQQTVLAAILKRDPDTVVSANNDFQVYSLLRSYYPCEVDKKEGFLNNFFVLAKRPLRSCKTPVNAGNMVPASKQNMALDSLVQYHTLLDTLLEDLRPGNRTQYVFTANVHTGAENPAILVMELRQGDSLLFWYGTNLHVRLHAGRSASHTYASFDFAPVIKKTGSEKTRLRIYLWNNRPVKSRFTHMRLVLRQPNHRFYGITEDIFPD